MPSSAANTRAITVAALTRVEGEGTLRLVVEDRQLVALRLEIFEPPRLFEAFLVDRHATEAPDLCARICGICPVAYQMSAVHALEGLCGVSIHPAVRALRRLFYCGEWIESHALHIHLLAAPDFFDCESVVALAQKERQAVERGLRLKKLGNAIIALLGGRSVHPVSACIGGFTRAPQRADLEPLRRELRRAHDDAVACVRWCAAIEVPDRRRDIEFVALHHPTEYPMNEGRLVSNKGIDCAPAEFDTLFEEHQMPFSNALHSRVRQRGPYFVGPLARVNLNFDRLGSNVQELARDTGISWPSSNPFSSLIARALEVLYAVEEAQRIIDTYEPPPVPAAPLTIRAGTGHAITEAPRGSLYQAFEIDEHGLIRKARIVPPTAQNQAQIEADLRALAPEILARSDAEARHLCEMVIRSYDPCISCATHFLRLEIDRR